ncbi:uncharacterized protein M421DRAFT_427190 [Didymella exigua CBS 183.55]|uniref:Uncharacterized protein n=1 Tax=Didymella exigua CBS 183.55 TaxID=1150837 RepID=A0A6A5R475_9PLEO|nr:uncharacterized protein M421DRAFT_427190 [Didymella exigua CBS 183.55]KAF1922189.1 hypothetical protein M421DRAFT_427190 [Didymella exigua CBS 183.55]
MLMLIGLFAILLGPTYFVLLLSTPKKRCHATLSSRNALIDRTLRCFTISISTL